MKTTERPLRELNPSAFPPKPGGTRCQVEVEDDSAEQDCLAAKTILIERQPLHVTSSAGHAWRLQVPPIAAWLPLPHTEPAFADVYHTGRVYAAAANGWCSLDCVAVGLAYHVHVILLEKGHPVS